MHEKPVRWNPISRLMDNPIIAKELKGRMRGRQGFVILTAYLSLISLIIICVYLYSVDDRNISRNYPNALQEMGRLIFDMVVMLELLMVVFIGPALTSGAISSERERGTFDLLRASLLSSRALVLGKLGTAVMYLLLLILAALPLQSLAFFLGGVGIAEMVISILMLASSAFLFCTLGLYFSSIARRTVVATVLSYAALILPAILVAMLYFLLDNGVIDLDLSTASAETVAATILILWTVLSSNPFMAALLTELMLEEEQSLFLIYVPGPDPALILFSPWILYVTFAVIMTVLMILLIVFYLNRYER
jgi:ABC-type transport system involved in multi-copper enzyme maturation permease subunit